MNTNADEKKDNQNDAGSVFQVPKEKTAYAVITVKITNREKFMEYVRGHIPSVIQYGGKFKLKVSALKTLKTAPSPVKNLIW
jgi:uncharacterized protein (DUF1330 family)